MHPSSVFKYFLNNKKRFAIVTLSVMLGVFLIYSVSTVISSMELEYRRSSLDPMSELSIVSCYGENLPPQIAVNIARQAYVERVIPMAQYTFSMRLAVGGFSGSYFWVVRPDDIGYLMNLMGLRLTEGSLPTAGRLETVMNRDVAKSLGISVGASVGSGMGFGEEYKVVGLMEGTPLVSFATLLINDAQKYNVIVVPKEGLRGEVDDYLRTIQSSKVLVRTYEGEAGALYQTTGSIDLLITAISITVMVIVSACVGFLCYIYFMQRQSEYGLLAAIGYTRQRIANRAFAEIGSMNLAGFILGFGLSMIAGLIMKTAFYEGYGQVLYAFNLDALSKAACVPIFSTFFSLAPVWRLMKKADPIHVIEA